jgi:hypothetical protein
VLDGLPLGGLSLVYGSGNALKVIRRIEAKLLGSAFFMRSSTGLFITIRQNYIKNHVSQKRIDARRLGSYNLWAFF